MCRQLLWQVLVALCSLQWSFLAQAEDVPLKNKHVVVSIAPLAGLVQPFLQEKDRLQILLKPGQSPHTFQLRPSQMLGLSQADTVLGVGGEVDIWLHKALQSMPNKSVLWMNQVAGGVLYPVRGHHHHKHDHEHGTALIDPHLWLSPQNAKAFVRAVGQQWQLEATQVEAWQARIARADQQVAETLKSVQSIPFVVLHDAFQYFERHYGLKNVGVIQLKANVNPSIRQVLKIRQLIQDKGVKCVVKEPQFSERQLRAVTQGFKVKVVAIDPLNTQNLPYDQFLLQLGQAFRHCLEGN